MHLAARPGQRLGVRTVRIVRSSSATRTVPSIYRSSFFLSRGAMGRDTRKTVRPGTESTEIQPSWSEMISETSARPEPAAVLAARDKGLEDAGGDLGLDAGAVVDDLDIERQRPGGPVLAPQAQRKVVEGAQPDRAPARQASAAF